MVIVSKVLLCHYDSIKCCFVVLLIAPHFKEQNYRGEQFKELSVNAGSDH